MPRYENDYHRKRQREIADALEPVLKVKFFGPCDLQAFDFRGLDGERKLKYFLECKDRTTYSSTTFKTLMIDSHKIRRGVYVADACRASYVLGIEWMDQLGYFVVPKDGVLQRGTGGRFDRGDPNDTDDEVFIPIRNFQWL